MIKSTIQKVDYFITKIGTCCFWNPSLYCLYSKSMYLHKGFRNKAYVPQTFTRVTIFWCRYAHLRGCYRGMLPFNVDDPLVYKSTRIMKGFLSSVNLPRLGGFLITLLQLSQRYVVHLPVMIVYAQLNEYTREKWFICTTIYITFYTNMQTWYIWTYVNRGHLMRDNLTTDLRNFKWLNDLENKHKTVDVLPSRNTQLPSVS